MIQAIDENGFSLITIKFSNNISFSDRVNTQGFHYGAENSSSRRFDSYTGERRFPENRNIDNTGSNNWESHQQRYHQRNNKMVSNQLFLRFYY